AITSPSQLIALAEHSALDAFPSQSTPVVDFGAPPAGGRNNPFMGHLATANFLFADGHVKALKWVQTYNTANGCSGSATVNMWHRDNVSGSTGLCANMNASVVEANKFQ
ncbi:MAG TPA: H-X9-DG-CTERM domain-containing protein, partial [Abditibacteriaceae bacterium]